MTKQAPIKRAFGGGKTVFNVNYKINPIYFDEVSLSKFTEEFLDIIIQNGYSKITKASGATGCSKFLQEIILLLEIDRVLLKSYNEVVSQFFDEHQAIIRQVLERGSDTIESGSSPQQNNEEEDPTKLLFHRVITFVTESLKYMLFTCFKRWKLILKLLSLIKGVPSQNFFKKSDSITSEEHCLTYVNFLIGSFWWFFKTLH